MGDVQLPENDQEMTPGDPAYLTHKAASQALNAWANASPSSANLATLASGGNADALHVHTGLVAARSTANLRFLSDHAGAVVAGDWGPALREARDTILAAYTSPNVGMGMIFMDRQYVPIRSTESWGSGTFSTNFWLPPGISLVGLGSGSARSGGLTVEEAPEHGGTVIASEAAADVILLHAPNGTGKADYRRATLRDFHVMDNTSVDRIGCQWGICIRSILGTRTFNVSVSYLYARTSAGHAFDSWPFVVDGEELDPINHSSGTGWQADFGLAVGLDISHCVNGIWLRGNAGADWRFVGCDVQNTVPGASTAAGWNFQNSCGLLVESSHVSVDGGNFLFHDKPVRVVPVHWRNGYRGRYFTMNNTHLEGHQNFGDDFYAGPMIGLEGNPTSIVNGGRYLEPHITSADLGNANTYAGGFIDFDYTLGFSVSNMRARGNTAIVPWNDPNVHADGNSAGHWNFTAVP